MTRPDLDPTRAPAVVQGPLAARLQPAVDEAEVARIWQQVRETQAARRRGPRRWPYLTAAGLAVAAALTLWWLRPAGDGATGAGPLLGEVTLDPGAVLGGAEPRVVAMADGSRVELDRRATLEVLTNEGDKFVTAVRRGRARFDVRPGGPRRWVIETDLATVEVVGTAFAVDRKADGLTVSVERGVVLVRGERVPGRVVRLTAGEQVDVRAESFDSTLADARAAQRTVGTSDGDVARDSGSGSVSGSGSGSGSGSVSASAPSTPTRPLLDGPATIARADARIAAGDFTGAARVLDDYLADADADASAGLAAFLLGRLAQDSLGDPDRAAAAFARALQIGSPRAVQDEALARRATALARAGRTEEARAVARGYLARYPAGTRAPAMTELIAP